MGFFKGLISGIGFAIGVGLVLIIVIDTIEKGKTDEKFFDYINEY